MPYAIDYNVAVIQKCSRVFQVAKHLKGGECVAYGARVLNEGIELSDLR